MANNFSFSTAPKLYRSRSQQDLSHIIKTTANVGTLYPFDCQEVYPGDTFKVNTNIVTRLSSTFFRPVIDNLFMDIYYFYVPSRLCYDKFKNVFGENTESAWANTTDYSVPILPSDSSSRTVVKGSVANCLGLPIGTISSNVPINILPFRAFALIYNEWFRGQNVIQPMHLQNGEYNDSEALNSNAWSPANYTGLCPPVAKLHDLFTSALPAPQKGNAVSIPYSFGFVPLRANPISTDADPANQLFNNSVYLGFNGPVNVSGNNWLLGANNVVNTPNSGDTEQFGRAARYSGGSTSSLPQYGYLISSNLGIDGSNTGGSLSVSDLRFATSYQRMLEMDALSGSRYTEFLRAHFGVSAPDLQLQRPEMLGGRRIPISITQVTQTTGEASETSPLGSVGGYSLTGGKSRYTKGFVEHGYVISVFCIRQFHTYQQGVERFWTRTKRTDYYDPAFSSISEQPIYTSELYAFGESDGERRVWGYGEPWYDLRTRQNRISGQLTTGIDDSMDYWHFGDYYSQAPTLSPDFLNETSNYVNRAITVESSHQDQFLIDFYMKVRAYRPLPVRSIPRLV